MNQDAYNTLFQDALNRFKNLKKTSEEVDPQHPRVPCNIWQDFFKPELEETSHDIVKQVRKNERFHKMREHTILNRPSTSLATTAMLKAIQDGRIKLPEKPKEAEKTPETPVEDSEVPRLYDIDDTEKGSQTDAEPQKSPEKEETPENINKAFEELTEKPEDVTKAEQEKIIQEAMNSSAIDKALEEGEQEIKKMRTLMRAMGLGEGVLQDIPEEAWEKFIPFIEEHKNIKELLDLAGRLYRTIDTKKRTSYVKGSGVIVGIETGNKIERLLPSELAKAKNPLLRSEFYRGLIEGSLLQFELEDKEPTKQGPVFVCVDQSGSMSGNPDKWAKALSLAIAKTMKKENRAFAFMPFSNKAGEVIYGKANGSGSTLNFEKLMPMLTSFMNGGTSFRKALKKALIFTNENEHFKKNADIIFITDGQDRLDTEHLEQIAKYKKEQGVSILGVQIGGSTECLEKFCDSIVLIGNNKNMNEKDDDIIKWILTPKEGRVD